MNDAYLQVAIVAVLGMVGWMARSVLADLKNGMKELSETIKALAQDLKEARKELDSRMDTQSSTLQISMTGLDRRLSVIEGRCSTEHGTEYRRRAEDIGIHRARP